MCDKRSRYGSRVHGQSEFFAVSCILDNALSVIVGGNDKTSAVLLTNVRRIDMAFGIGWSHKPVTLNGCDFDEMPTAARDSE